ncbi:MAG TPA: histidine kinase dimerization/phospho-acceptor domain-containing protein [Gaiellaceae bacterium]|nr:histidine kinase dimerization/phospho-acceptor domain-containing protein [Gaiellaceae bacterium]
MPADSPRADFSRLVSLACHDLRTPLATVQGFAKTLLRQDEVGDPAARYLGIIDEASDELVQLLDVLSAAARIEGGRYDPLLQEADSFALAQAAVPGATGSGAPVQVDVDAVERSLAALARAASRHGGVEVSVAVAGAEVSIAPITAEAAPIVLGDDPKDLGAAVAVRLVRELGGEVVLAGERLIVTLPS